MSDAYVMGQAFLEPAGCSNVPVMMSTSLDESTALIGNFPVTEQNYTAAIHARYGEGAEQVEEVYP